MAQKPITEIYKAHSRASNSTETGSFMPLLTTPHRGARGNKHKRTTGRYPNKFVAFRRK